MVEKREEPWLAAHLAQGLGYYGIQSTRPQALAPGINDSPAGWCTWVLDRLHFWLDSDRLGVRDIRHALSWDKVLTNISLYWFTDTICTSVRLYREQRLAEFEVEAAVGTIVGPTGVAIYPKEFRQITPSLDGSSMPCEAPVGGHFAAWEQPEIFARDLRTWQDRVFDEGA